MPIALLNQSLPALTGNLRDSRSSRDLADAEQNNNLNDISDVLANSSDTEVFPPVEPVNPSDSLFQDDDQSFTSSINAQLLQDSNARFSTASSAADSLVTRDQVDDFANLPTSSQAALQSYLFADQALSSATAEGAELVVGVDTFA